MPVHVLGPTMESTRCVACGGPLDARNHVLRCGSPVTGGIISECSSCGTNQVIPRPSPEQLSDLYDADYYEGFIEGAGMAGGNSDVSPVLRQRLVEIERRVPKGRLLDVGCGLGLFVRHAVEQGWDAAGLEPSVWAAAEGRRRNHVTIHGGEINTAPIEPGSLDVIHFHHVIEHVVDPVAAMTAARRLLRRGGIAVIEVPQELRYPISDRFFRRLHPDLYRSETPAATHHLTFFSPRGLKVAAERAGLVVERAGTVRHIRTDDSRLPLGVPAKRLLYWSEAALQTAPDIELWATRT